MALDELVDSTQLDSDLTSVANAIRTKGGTSASLAFPAGFVSAIGDIPSGGNKVLSDEKAYRNFRIYKNADVSSEISVDFSLCPGIFTMDQLIDGNMGFTKLTITPPPTAKSTQRLVYSNSTIITVEIVGTLYAKSNSSTNAGFINSNGNLKTITGLIDLSEETWANFYNATNYQNGLLNSKLETISLVPGTMSMTTTNWYLGTMSALTDDSLISIANALKDTYSGTITFHATPKARLSTIMGTVATADGLSTFTKSASGTVTLENFLTVTKGATLA